ncbi:YbaB/EbfC family nucleoid-associated protein [candidate division KSB1 bacterium]|nr:YbaB/EbfC family nucleoid-associated protein [candidate division KSB1 bacterium]
MNKGSMGNLFKQAQKMQAAMQKTQENLVNIQVEGTSGGGMVTVTANAAQEIISIAIDPEVIDPQDREMLEDLVLAAVNQALDKARGRAQEEMSKVTGGIMPNLPGL